MVCDDVEGHALDEASVLSGLLGLLSFGLGWWAGNGGWLHGGVLGLGMGLLGVLDLVWEDQLRLCLFL